MEKYIIDDLWYVIKSYLFHNIKIHGKHLKVENKNVCLYNEIVKSIPIIQYPRTGPRIIYNSAKKDFRVAKLLYHGKQLKNGTRPLYNSIIEYISIKKFEPKGFTLYGKQITKQKNIKQYYYENIKNVKSKLT
jgi:hypothetical protein